MDKKCLLFAPVTFDLAETTRMIEIAKGISNHPAACQVFDIQFISNGGDLEHLIEEQGFPLKRLEPRLTPEKIEFIGKVDKGEKFSPAFTQREIIAMVRKGFAIWVPKSKDPSRKVQEAIQQLLHDETAKKKAEEFSKVMEKWDGPSMAAELLYEELGGPVPGLDPDE